MARENVWLIARRGGGPGLEQERESGAPLFSAAMVEPTEPVCGHETSGHPRGPPCRGHGWKLLEERSATVHTDSLKFF